MTKNIAGGSADIGGETGVLLAGRYRTEEVVGRGGMATVYRARDEALGRTVALKVFHAALADEEDLRRQNEEIRLIARLNHFALVTLFDAVTDDSDGGSGRSLIVMQYIDGTDLRRRPLHGVLDPRTVAMMGADLAEALAYVHAQGVIHRDIKPANILLPNRENEATGPQAMLADFGIARIVDSTRLTATGSVLGTANYLSPEQALGGRLSPATDVYSLGLVLIECLTGDKSFPGSALESVSARLGRDPVVPLQFGEGWHELLREMTRREPSERIDAANAADTLRRLAVARTAVPLEEDNEDLAPTLKYPVDDGSLLRSEEPTVVLGAPGAVASRVRRKRTTKPPRTEAARVRSAGSRVALVSVIAGLIVVLGLGFATWAIVAGTQNPTPSPTSLSYPHVGGELGVHLQQLQRTVQP